MAVSLQSSGCPWPPSTSCFWQLWLPRTLRTALSLPGPPRTTFFIFSLTLYARWYCLLTSQIFFWLTWHPIQAPSRKASRRRKLLWASSETFKPHWSFSLVYVWLPWIQRHGCLRSDHRTARPKCRSDTKLTMTVFQKRAVLRENNR